MSSSCGLPSVGPEVNLEATEERMRRFGPALLILSAVVLFTSTAVFAGAASSAADVPLKEAKLNIEHNATDKDTGFQGFIDSEGWRRIDVRGPGGDVLAFEARGSLGRLGLTELFFETVEPENAAVPIKQMLAKLPEGRYTIAGPAQENGKSPGRTSGIAWLTHDIPAGPTLVSPAEDATVPTRGVVARWKPVSKTITGEPVKIVAYQLIIEKDANPPRHMIGKFGLSMHLPPSVTSIAVPNGFLEPRTAYNWEVLAIERSGNQTLSSGSFRTR
jgi:hypothetical protein